MNNSLFKKGIILCTAFAMFGLVGCKKHVHEYADYWTADAEYHWHDCTGCEEVDGKAAHTFDAGVVTTKPTSEAEGSKTYTCDVCGREETEAIAKLACGTKEAPLTTDELITLVKTLDAEQIAASTFYVKGTIKANLKESQYTAGTFRCELEDADETYVVMDYFAKQGEGVTDKLAYGDLIYLKGTITIYQNTKLEFTDSGEVYKVVKCAHEAGLTEHVANAATCIAAGNTKYYECPTCGRFYSDEAGTTEIAKDSWVVAATGHTPEHHDAVPATVLEEGNVEYWYCDDCEKYFSDAECTTEITTIVADKLVNEVNVKENCGVNFTFVAQTNDVHAEAGVIANETNNAAGTGLAVRVKNNTGIDTPVAIQIHDTDGNRSLLKTAPVVCNIDLDGNWSVQVWDGTNAWRNNDIFVKIPANFDGWIYIAYDQFVNRTDYGANPCDVAKLYAVWFDVNMLYDAYADINVGAMAALTDNGWVLVGDTTKNVCTHWVNDGTAKGNEWATTNAVVVKGIAPCTLEEHKEVAATCTTAGTSAYYECTNCHWYYSDAEGTKGIAKPENDIPAHHTLEKVDYVKPTPASSGNIEHYRCTGTCGGLFLDDKGLNPTTADAVELKFAAAPTADALVYDLTGKVAADLADDWEIKKYGDGWVATGATISLATDYNNDPALKCKVWNNGTKFRFTVNYDTIYAWEGIQLVAKGDGVTKFTVQLMMADGSYMTYTPYTTLSADWTTYTINMQDMTQWTINGSYTYAQVAGAMGITNPNQILCMFTKLHILFYGTSQNGQETSVLMNNIKFVKNTCTTGASMILYDTKNAYAINDGTTTYTFTFDRTNEKVTFTPASMEFALVEEGANVTMTATAGTVINAEYVANGRKLKINSITNDGGAMQALVGQILITPANVNLDFSDTTTGSNYRNAQWSGQYYGNNGWTAFNAGDNMRGKNVGENKNVNFYVDTNTRNYIYTLNADQVGTAKSFSMKIANYFASSPATINYKVKVTDTAGNQVYVAGDASNFAALARDTSQTYTTIQQTLNNIEVATITLTVKCGSGNGYVYVDDIVVAY